GKLQQISAFSTHSSALLPSAPALPPNTFTNWPEQKSQVPASATVILLDALNSHIEDRQWVKKHVVRFLRSPVIEVNEVTPIGQSRSDIAETRVNDHERDRWSMVLRAKLIQLPVTAELS